MMDRKYLRLVLDDVNDPASQQEQVNVLGNQASKAEPQPNKEICIWTEAETTLLLDLYEQYMARIGPMKQFKTKKSMWIKLPGTINNKFNTFKTALQCENRYKTVLKRKKTAVGNNSKSGNSREVIPFDLSKIASADDSIEPEVTGTAKQITILKPQANEQASSSNISTSTPKRKTLLEIYERKKAARERRHKDKMELLQKLFGSKEDIILL